MPKKTRTSTTVTRVNEEVPEKNPVSVAIKNFFDSGELSEDLTDVQLTIRVRKYNPRIGKFETLIGTTYSDLQGMLDTLTQRYGAARYKFYVMTKDIEGKPGPTVVIDDYPIVPDGDEQEEPQGDIFDENDGNTPVEPQPAQPDPTFVFIVEQFKQQNALIMEMIKQLGNAKGGGGGFKFGDISELIQMGAAFGSGMVPKLPADDQPGDDQGGGIMGGGMGKLLENVLAKVITDRIASGGLPMAAPPMPTPPPQPVTIPAETTEVHTETPPPTQPRRSKK